MINFKTLVKFSRIPRTTMAFLKSRVSENHSGFQSRSHGNVVHRMFLFWVKHSHPKRRVRHATTCNEVALQCNMLQNTVVQPTHSNNLLFSRFPISTSSNFPFPRSPKTPHLQLRQLSFLQRFEPAGCCDTGALRPSSMAHSCFSRLLLPPQLPVAKSQPKHYTATKIPRAGWTRGFSS